MKHAGTAEDFYNDYHFNYKGQENYVTEAMRQFAKMHVKSAIRALTRVQYDKATTDEVDYLTEVAITEFYPLTKII